MAKKKIAHTTSLEIKTHGLGRPGKDYDFGKYKNKKLKFGESLPKYEERNKKYIEKQKEKKINPSLKKTIKLAKEQFKKKK